MGFVNIEQAEYWAGRAESWTSREGVNDLVIGPAGWLAMDRLDPRPGQMIVDLGCGTGQTTVELGRRVAPGGQVVGVDIAAAMFERARQHIADAGIDNVELVHADAQSSTLGRERFDGGYSRFGVMFFSDPVAAFENVRSALKPGALLSFVCWQPLPANDWMLVPAQAAATVLGALPEKPAADAPGPFSLSEPGRVDRILDAAGFLDIDVAAQDDSLVIPHSGISDLADSSLQVGPVRQMLQDAEPKQIALVRQAIVDALASRLMNGEVALSRAYLLVRARA